MSTAATASEVLDQPLRIRRGLKVLQVIDGDPYNYPPTLNTARVLAAAGAEVLCIGGARQARPAVPMPASARIEYAIFGAAEPITAKLKWGLGRFAFRRTVEQRAREFKPHLVIAYDTGAGWAALRIAEARTLKTVLHIHDNEDERYQSWRSVRSWQWTQLRRHTHDFDALVVPERARGDHLKHTWKIQTAVTVVANAPPRARSARNSILRDQLGVPPSAPLAVVVGTMGMLPETVRAIARAREPWHLVVIGAQDRAMLTDMLAAADAVNVRQRVHVIGYTDYDTVRTWLPGCDLGLALYPPRANGSLTSINWRVMGTASVKLMEYMAAGIPAIVYSRDAFAELASQTRAVRVLDDDDERTLTRMFDDLTPSESSWRTAADAAIETHLSLYNAEAQLQTLLTTLELDRA